ncbi:S-methyl-5-thioribose-1-phosphate isomerase [Adlercreutzia sp. ZJ305]|uniref:S-methyl-5-thioribose-1-phosphate isomerase n=1 Tax=Adlercreutzia sp. ZJ305 TaxID=2709408 RepID=UPI001F14EB14|nr:S-methyl-5-thioribose-1-phosphate isomerase [Adlercreutzia sp. ZJ305]
MELHLERLPRTVELVRTGQRAAGVEGFVPALRLLDQTQLPSREVYCEIFDWREVIEAIKALRVRGAPAIGIAGAAAVALRAAEFVWARADDHRADAGDFERVFVLDERDFDPDLYWDALELAARMIADARPTAVNLSWAVRRACAVARTALDMGSGPREVADALFDFTRALAAEDEAANRAIGAHGAGLLPEGARVLTHCNAGSLATSFFGTALGVVYAAAEQGKIERVYADETRPVGQGARLTAWELARAGVPVTLICDDMAASAMAAGLVDAVVVGADRITARGDVANKIGTYGVAVLAAHHGIPFYVAAPSSTIDFSLERGADIPIEQRAASEVCPEAIPGVDVLNPAFDVTPADLVCKIITEHGAFPPRKLAEAYRKE